MYKYEVAKIKKRKMKMYPKSKKSQLETRNLNRNFRCKINEFLRELAKETKCEMEKAKIEDVLKKLNKSEKIMFSEIKETLKDEWLKAKLNRCSAMLLKYIHSGKMGLESKKLMLKYFNKMMRAVARPENFTCWK